MKSGTELADCCCFANYGNLQEALITPPPTSGLTAERSWQLPWLLIHLTARDLHKIPVGSYAWPAAKRALEECAQLRQRMIDGGWFN